MEFDKRAVIGAECPYKLGVSVSWADLPCQRSAVRGTSVARS